LRNTWPAPWTRRSARVREASTGSIRPLEKRATRTGNCMFARRHRGGFARTTFSDAMRVRAGCMQSQTSVRLAARIVRLSISSKPVGAVHEAHVARCAVMRSLGAALLVRARLDRVSSLHVGALRVLASSSLGASSVSMAVRRSVSSCLCCAFLSFWQVPRWACEYVRPAWGAGNVLMRSLSTATKARDAMVTVDGNDAVVPKEQRTGPGEADKFGRVVCLQGSKREARVPRTWLRRKGALDRRLTWT
jgi:hypothetical protein